MDPKKCARCKKIVPRREHLTCLNCKLTFDIDCLNISYNLFQLMNTEKKEHWKCLQCKQNLKKKEIKSNTTPTNNKEPRKNTPQNRTLPASKKCTVTDKTPAMDNVTTRQKRMRTSSAEENLDSEEIQEPEIMYDSLCPSLVKSKSTDALYDYSSTLMDTTKSRSVESIRDLDILDEMKQEIGSLQEKLAIAENEMDNILSENCELHRKVKTLTQEISVLKKICSSPSPLKRIRNRHSISPKESPLRKTEYITQILTLERNISELQGKLHTAQNEITKLNQIIMKYQNNIHEQNSLGQRLPRQELVTSESLHRNSWKETNNNSEENYVKRKLCILSTTNTLKITQIMHSEYFYSDFEFCNYIRTNSTIDTLTKDIESKISTLTLNDYCIIMIGESDFYCSQDHITLVQIIKNRLNNITNTNVIIAAPTYICGKLLFNNRIENFNNEIYHSLRNQANVHVFDSNRRLTLDMFSSFSGKLNNKGMRCILGNLAKFITSLQTNYRDAVTNNDTCPSPRNTEENHDHNEDSQFFLL